MYLIDIIRTRALLAPWQFATEEVLFCCSFCTSFSVCCFVVIQMVLCFILGYGLRQPPSHCTCSVLPSMTLSIFRSIVCAPAVILRRNGLSSFFPHLLSSIRRGPVFAWFVCSNVEFDDGVYNNTQEYSVSMGLMVGRGGFRCRGVNQRKA